MCHLGRPDRASGPLRRTRIAMFCHYEETAVPFFLSPGGGFVATPAGADSRLVV